MEIGGLSPPLPAEAPASGLNLYRPPRRVVVLLFLAPVFYEIWWYWQLFGFTRREGFPRSRSFWWLLVPVYGWVVLYRQFDDLQHTTTTLRARPLSSGLAIWLVVFSWFAGGLSNRISNSHDAFAAFLLSGLFIALMGALVQPAANAYLKSKHPDAPLVGMTWGEITAAVLGILLLALVALGSFGAFSSSKSSSAKSVTQQPSLVAPALSQLRPIALRTGDLVQLSKTRAVCSANRDHGVVWLDCVDRNRELNPIPGSFSASISAQGVIIERFDKKGNTRTVAERAEPSSNGLVAIPVPKRKTQSGSMPLGSVLPIGGSPVVCDTEREAGLPTLLCGLAHKITGPNSALNVSYSPSTYGLAMSRSVVAIIRWNRNGTYRLVISHREPAS